jgi:hypothetical protein
LKEERDGRSTIFQVEERTKNSKIGMPSGGNKGKRRAYVSLSRFLANCFYLKISTYFIKQGRVFSKFENNNNMQEFA